MIINKLTEEIEAMHEQIRQCSEPIEKMSLMKQRDEIMHQLVAVRTELAVSDAKKIEDLENSLRPQAIQMPFKI